jgi:hypothetical protein
MQKKQTYFCIVGSGLFLIFFLQACSLISPKDEISNPKANFLSRKIIDPVRCVWQFTDRSLFAKSITWKFRGQTSVNPNLELEFATDKAEPIQLIAQGDGYSDTLNALISCNGVVKEECLPVPQNHQSFKLTFGASNSYRFNSTVASIRYCFQMYAPGTLLLSIDPLSVVSGKLKVLLYSRDEDGKLDSSLFVPTISGTSINNFPIQVPKAGTYAIGFKNESPTETISTFSVQLYEGDANEPNETFQTARDISFCQPVQVSIFPATDQDFFRFQLKKAGLIKVTIGNVSVPNFGWSIYDAADLDSVVFPFKNLGAGPEVNGLSPVEAGLYWINLKANSSSVSMTSFPITICVDTTDPNEPNQLPSQATSISQNTLVSGKMQGIFDMDRYRINVVNPGLDSVEVEMTNLPGSGNLKLEVYSQPNDVSTNKIFEKDLPESGGVQKATFSKQGLNQFFIRLRFQATPSVLPTNSYQFKVYEK